MSAYVVDDSTINKVVSYFNIKAMGNNGSEWFLKPLGDLGYDLQDSEDCKRLAEDMFKLNCEAVEQRYGEGEAAEFRPLDFEYRFQIPAPAIVILKALECWSYQCCEGNVPETSDLYQAMYKVCNSMCVDIVHKSPQYQGAAWG